MYTQAFKLRVHARKIISKTYVVGTQKKRLNEMGFFEHLKQNLMLKLTGKNIFTILRSNILLI